jgi:site-specific DNA recombinase
MGRLTLNVLLSFAQFEREVTAERIRDKIAASKRKGLWVGGMVPLGYDLKDGKLLIIDHEAELVRSIFRRYLELGSVNRVVIELGKQNVRSKIRKLANGTTRGGVPFRQGALFYMLRNRFYLGEVLYKGEIHPGPQPPLMERGLFDAVQQRLTEQRAHSVTTRNKNAALLRGILFDEAGHPMTPTHSTKQGVRYRYYVSEPFLRGYSKAPPGLTFRVPAAEIESSVINALESCPPDAINLSAQVARVEVRKNVLAVWLQRAGSEPVEDDAGSEAACDQTPPLLIPWTKPPSKRFKEILVPHAAQRPRLRPIKFERRAALIKSISRGRTWLDEIISSRATVEEIAVRQKCSIRHINMTLSMAFIAPGLVKAAIEGRLPRGIGVANLREAPAEWSLQYQRLGLTPAE